jgi:hypothetical protein
MHKSTLSKIESGDRFVLDYELAAFADALRVRVEQLLPFRLPRGMEALAYHSEHDLGDVD